MERNGIIGSKIAGYDIEVFNEAIYVANATSISINKLSRSENKVIYSGYNKPFSAVSYWSKSARIGNKILFIPNFGDEFVVIDICSEVVKRLDIRLDKYTEALPKFWEIVVHDIYFFVMGYGYPGIIRINSKTLEVNKQYLNFEGFHVENNDDFGDFYFGDGYVKDNSFFYFAFGKKKALCKLNFATDKYDIIDINSRLRSILCISGCADSIWMTEGCESDSIGVYNLNTGICKEITLSKAGYYYAPIFYGENAYVFPMSTGGCIFKINMDSLNYEVFDKLDFLLCRQGFRKTTDSDIGEMGSDDDRVADIMMAKKIENKIIFIRRPDYAWFTYDLNTEELASSFYFIEDKEYLQKLKLDHDLEIIKSAIIVQHVITEEQIPLADYLSALNNR